MRSNAVTVHHANVCMYVYVSEGGWGVWLFVHLLNVLGIFGLTIHQAIDMLWTVHGLSVFGQMTVFHSGYWHFGLSFFINSVFLSLCLFHSEYWHFGLSFFINSVFLSLCRITAMLKCWAKTCKVSPFV